MKKFIEQLEKVSSNASSEDLKNAVLFAAKEAKESEEESKRRQAESMKKELFNPTEKIPFQDYRPTYVEDVKKTVSETKIQLERLLREDFFMNHLRKNVKSKDKLREIWDSLRQYLYEMERSCDVIDMEKKFIEHEMKLFRKHLSDREEMIVTSMCREQTLERKLTELRREMSSLSKSRIANKVQRHNSMKNIPSSKKQSKLPKNFERYDLLTETELSSWILEHSKLSSVQNEHEDLTNQQKFMKSAIDEKLEFLEATRSSFDRRIQVKDDQLKELRKKITNRKNKMSKKDILEYEKKIKNLESEIQAIQKEKDKKLESVNLAVTNLQEKYDAVLNQLMEQEELLKKYEDIRSQEDENYPKEKVTFVFTDIQSSSLLWEKSMEGMVQALRIHNECMRSLMPKYRGYEVKTEGDAFMIAFESSFDAVNYCVKAQVELLNQGWPEFVFELPECKEVRDRAGKSLLWNGLRVRMGVHVGSVPALVYGIDPVTHRCDYFGPPVNRAARVESVACGGEICVSTDVWDEISPIFKKLDVPSVCLELGQFALKGMEDNPEIIRSIFPKTLVGRRRTLEKRKFLPVGAEKEEKKKSKNKERPSLERQMSVAEMIGESEELGKLKSQTEVFWRLIMQRIVQSKRASSDTISKMDEIFKAPGKISTSPDLPKNERKLNTQIHKSMKDEMLQFKDLITSGKVLDEDSLKKLEGRIQFLRSKNSKKKRKGPSVKPRYMDHFSSSGAAERLKRLKSDKRFRRKTHAFSGSEKCFDGKNPLSSTIGPQTALPGIKVSDSIFSSPKKKKRRISGGVKRKYEPMQRIETMDLMGLKHIEKQHEVRGRLNSSHKSNSVVFSNSHNNISDLSDKKVEIEFPDISKKPKSFKKIESQTVVNIDVDNFIEIPPLNDDSRGPSPSPNPFENTSSDTSKNSTAKNSRNTSPTRRKRKRKSLRKTESATFVGMKSSSSIASMKSSLRSSLRNSLRKKSYNPLISRKASTTSIASNDGEKKSAPVKVVKFGF